MIFRGLWLVATKLATDVKMSCLMVVKQVMTIPILFQRTKAKTYLVNDKRKGE